MNNLTVSLAAPIEVIADPADCPAYLKAHSGFWIGQQLRKAGIPLFERALSEGVRTGTLTTQTLESGSVLYRWSPSEAS